MTTKPEIYWVEHQRQLFMHGVAVAARMAAGHVAYHFIAPRNRVHFGFQGVVVARTRREAISALRHQLGWTATSGMRRATAESVHRLFPPALEPSAEVYSRID